MEWIPKMSSRTFIVLRTIGGLRPCSFAFSMFAFRGARPEAEAGSQWSELSLGVCDDRR
ncbi:hypothetical protein [Burkholderia cepacia]|uniref:hypothetical protein n=1 Tax=Burkholderia cepacia TaxID=292 RepID=UPI002FE2D995